MPKLRRRALPPALLQHLLDRAHQREINYSQLQALYHWMTIDPEVPSGRWFKKFSGFTICGEGELIKTFLLPTQTPTGEEVH